MILRLGQLFKALAHHGLQQQSKLALTVHKHNSIAGRKSPAMASI